MRRTRCSPRRPISYTQNYSTANPLAIRFRSRRAGAVAEVIAARRLPNPQRHSEARRDHNVVKAHISFYPCIQRKRQSGRRVRSWEKSTTGLALLRLIRSEGRIVSDLSIAGYVKNRRQLYLFATASARVVIPDPNSSLNPRLNVRCNITGMPARPPAYMLSVAQREQQVKAPAMEVGLDPENTASLLPLSFPAASVNVSPSPWR